MLETLSNYLKNEEYRITLLKDKVHVLNYKSIIDINENNLLIRIDKDIIKVVGNDIKLLKLDKKELLISGKIKEIITSAK